MTLAALTTASERTKALVGDSTSTTEEMSSGERPAAETSSALPAGDCKAANRSLAASPRPSRARATSTPPLQRLHLAS